MARRTVGLRQRKGKSKVVDQIRDSGLDYHEGLSANQVKVILHELGFDRRARERFDEWMYGQTCPIIARYKADGSGIQEVVGVYEHDFFRWVAAQKTGVPPSWD